MILSSPQLDHSPSVKFSSPDSVSCAQKQKESYENQKRFQTYIYIYIYRMHVSVVYQSHPDYKTLYSVLVNLLYTMGRFDTYGISAALPLGTDFIH